VRTFREANSKQDKVTRLYASGQANMPLDIAKALNKRKKSDLFRRLFANFSQQKKDDGGLKNKGEIPSSQRTGKTTTCYY
jgi:hypothetical protein